MTANWKTRYRNLLKKIYKETECVCGSFDPDDWMDIPSMRHKRGITEAHVQSCIVYYAYTQLNKMKVESRKNHV